MSFIGPISSEETFQLEGIMGASQAKEDGALCPGGQGRRVTPAPAPGPFHTEQWDVRPVSYRLTSGTQDALKVDKCH